MNQEGYSKDRYVVESVLDSCSVILAVALSVSHSACIFALCACLLAHICLTVSICLSDCLYICLLVFICHFNVCENTSTFQISPESPALIRQRSGTFQILGHSLWCINSHKETIRLASCSNSVETASWHASHTRRYRRSKHQSCSVML